MTVTPSSLLKQFYERKKSSRTSFSIRTFAKAMKLSPSFASAMIQGKKAIPLSRLDELARILELDLLSINSLKKAMAEQILEDIGLPAEQSSSSSKSEAAMKYQPVPQQNFSILSRWYFVAILDLCTCANFKKDFSWIATQLGITQFQVEFAVSNLINHGLLVETSTGYQKVIEKIRLSFHQSHADIRNYHSQMIDKAKEELNHKTSAQDFSRREITGITIAANPANIERARLHLIKSLHEVAEILSEGETTDLYQINAQLFTLLKK